MLAVKMHLDSSETKELIKKYNIWGFPTIVFVDSTSLEIDRSIGYKSPIEFLKELKRIKSGVGTISDLIKKTQNDPNKFQWWMDLASKYEDKKDIVSAVEVWESVAEAGLGDAVFVKYKLTELYAYINKDVIELEYYIADNLNSEYAPYAFKSVISILRNNKDIEAEADAWRRYINLLELKKSYTPSDYNSFAWRMAELDMNLDKALEKIRLGIEMVNINDSTKLAGFKDTEAEVLWKMGNVEEAIKVINECIAVQPDEKYFKDQKKKFLKSVE